MCRDVVAMRGNVARRVPRGGIATWGHGGTWGAVAPERGGAVALGRGGWGHGGTWGIVGAQQPQQAFPLGRLIWLLRPYTIATIAIVATIATIAITANIAIVARIGFPPLSGLDMHHRHRRFGD